MKKVALRFSIFLILLGLVSCGVKDALDEVENKSDAVGVIQEYVQVAKLFQDASNGSDEAVVSAEIEAAEGLKSQSGNSIITIKPKDFTTFPKTISVDFGDGVTGLDGIKRKGKLIITSSAWYRTAGSVHTTVFEDYYQNDNRIEGLHVATNKGFEAGTDKLKFGVLITEGKVTTPEGAVMRYTQNTERTWVKGQDTPLLVLDDAYEVTGSQSGVSSTGVEFSLEITEPLYVVNNPRDITEGILSMAIDGVQEIEIDYNTKTMIIGNVVIPLND